VNLRAPLTPVEDRSCRPRAGSGQAGSRRQTLADADAPPRATTGQGWYLAIEGPTGAGKTTLARRLAPLLAAEISLDPFDANPFLAAMAGGTRRQAPGSALASEMTFLALRVAELRGIGKILRSGTDMVADWALAKTRVFPHMTLSPADAQRVQASCRLWEPGLPEPDLIIYLHADPHVLMTRISRRGRPFERAITSAELGRLSALFSTALCDLPVLPIDAAAFDVSDDAAVTSLVQHLRTIRKERPMNAATLAPSPARRLQITAPCKVQLTDEQLPQLTSTQVLARTLVSGISHGTEMAWFRGRAAALLKGWDSAARLYQEDAEPRAYPVAPGYESVAAIEMIGSDVEGLSPGALVYLDRPHADLHIVDGSEAARGLVPHGVTAEQAVFYPLARVALGAIHDAAIHVGDAVTVTGLGVVGLLAVQLARLAGAGQVIGIDRYRVRLDAARRLGADVVDATSTPDPAAQVRQMTSGRGADTVIEASGSYRLLHQAIRCAAPAGRVVTVASYHGDQHGLSLGEEYQRNRITLISSMTIGGVPHRSHPAWDLDRLNITARSLVNAGTLVTTDLITHRIPFADAGIAYDLIDTAPETTVKVVLTYDQ
jgi:NADPH:quinone reductase-like Zn-dependent oxidoreductase/deoxyadenosine/deoxycytidine kinase